MLPRYLRHILVPTLKPGDIVVMDNLGSQRSRAVRDTMRAAGARLWFLPPYSPDLNPIEQCFAKIKHWMETGPRTRHREHIEKPRRTHQKPLRPTKPETTSQTQDTLQSKRDRL